MHHHRWVVRVSRNVGMHGGAMTQLSRMGGHLGRGIAWLSHIHTHWTTPRHIIPWHTLQPCRGRERGGGECWGLAADIGPRSRPARAQGGRAPARGGMRSHGPVSAVASAELGVSAWTHSDGNRNGPRVKKNTQERPPPSKYRVFGDKTAFCFYG